MTYFGITFLCFFVLCIVLFVRKYIKDVMAEQKRIQREVEDYINEHYS